MHRAALVDSASAAGFPRRRGDAPYIGSLRLKRERFPPQARGCTHSQPGDSQPRRVSPAGAGMHRHCPFRQVPGGCFPRRRGDAPVIFRSSQSGSPFPPQARGCTPVVGAFSPDVGVSPAGAGMHPPGIRVVGWPPRFPPQARGCTRPSPRARKRALVSPAGAGMHPWSTRDSVAPGRFPRRRGDAPRNSRGRPTAAAFPPQARGCTPGGRLGGQHPPVSPAGAGMHLTPGGARATRHGFPRRRGDAPRVPLGGPAAPGFPPQARGCTPASQGLGGRLGVSPAGAGMHPGYGRGARPPSCFPRRRGDAPRYSPIARSSTRFPPQARGCTAPAGRGAAGLRVSPAGAGMHPAAEAAKGAPHGFPRRRGDAPALALLGGANIRFPPQARGCTLVEVS